MPVEFEVKCVKVGNSIKVTIPKELVNHLKLAKGDTVVMCADNSHLVLRKK